MQKRLNTYLTMLLVPSKIEVLTLALHVKLFHLIETGKRTSNAMAIALDNDPKNMEIFLDALVALGLLVKKKGVYYNTEVARTFFDVASPQYCGDVFLHKKEMLWQGNKMLSGLLKEGNKKAITAKHPKKWAHAAKKVLKQEQKNLIAHIAVKIAKSIPTFPTMTNMLDLGCASGIIGLEILKANPSLKGVFFDYPEVVEVVQENISEYNLQSRASTLSGDLQQDAIGSGYDLIWCSNIFYFLENEQEILKKIHNALNPNGILISAHVEVDETNPLGADGFFHFLFLNLQGRRTFKPDALTSLFKKANFETLQTYVSHEMPMTPTTIHLLKKSAS
ncbi:MAG: methyltransferase domain-containing protein [Campylobacterales bacterium]|nr:methyltransferase domain-containing protein [Campylobacterales bacterium]